MEVLMPFSCVADANLDGIHQAMDLTIFQAVSQILFRCEF